MSPSVSTDIVEYVYKYVTVRGMMKMGNNVPKVGFEPTPLAVWDKVINISPPRFPHIITLSIAI